MVRDVPKRVSRGLSMKNPPGTSAGRHPLLGSQRMSEAHPRHGWQAADRSPGSASPPSPAVTRAAVHPASEAVFIPW